MFIELALSIIRSILQHSTTIICSILQHSTTIIRNILQHTVQLATTIIRSILQHTWIEVSIVFYIVASNIVQAVDWIVVNVLDTPIGIEILIVLYRGYVAIERCSWFLIA